MAMKILDVISPWRSLAARMSIIFSVLSLVFATLAGLFVSKIARDAAEQDVGRLFAARAEHISQVIDDTFGQDMRGLDVAVGILGIDGLVAGQGQETSLTEAIRKELADAVLVGIADSNGHVIASDNPFGDKSGIAKMPWFKNALVHQIVAVNQELNLSFGKFDHLAVVASPIKDGGGATSGVAFAYLQTSWLENLWRQSDANLPSARKTELQVFTEDGFQLIRNTTIKNDNLTFAQVSESLASNPADAQQGFLVKPDALLGFAKNTAVVNFDGTDWIVVMRQPLSLAYESANRIGFLISLSSLLLGLLLSGIAAVATWFMTHRVSRIAVAADALRLGQKSEFAPLAGIDEPARISHSLAQLFNSLKSTNLELEDMNRNLDKKVAERTKEVQRLSEETRNAAMTRERLRISRDLHDTLAHSMLAMLTQIRLMKKLLQRKPEALAEELEQAEIAAQEGLNRARAAVVDLRYYAVRDDGLGQALQKLVSKLKERLDVDVRLTVDAGAAALSGPKAETAYRVAEEALHNVEKHAGATEVKISVKLDQASALEHRLELVIADNGKGFDPSARREGHFGLIGMQEQADVLGAQLDIQSAHGGGTTLTLIVPV